MFFLDRLDLDRRFRLLRREFEGRGVSEELRGWSFDSPPVEPPSRSVLFSVSELAGRYCESMRDIYLRRVLNVKPPPSVKMARGVVLHAINREVLSIVKRLLFSGGVKCGSELVENLLPMTGSVVDKAISEAEGLLASFGEDVRVQLRGEASAFFRFLSIQAAARVDQVISKYPHSDVDSIVSIAVPPVVERKVDGSLVGLSRELSVDIYTPFNAIADLKTGEVREFHPYAATGYALAIEAEEGESGWRHQRVWGETILEDRGFPCDYTKMDSVCLICDLFGTAGLKSLIEFSDFIGLNVRLEALDLPYGMKVYAAPQGSEFSGEISFMNLKDYELGLLLLGMGIVNGSTGRSVILGRFKYRGLMDNKKFGRVKYKINKINLSKFSDKLTIGNLTINPGSSIEGEKLNTICRELANLSLKYFQNELRIVDEVGILEKL
jgi:CRISPR-associated protein Csa1